MLFCILKNKKLGGFPESAKSSTETLPHTHTLNCNKLGIGLGNFLYVCLLL